MEKELLKKILQNYPSSSVSEAKDLHSLRQAYPYSQLLHVLAARTSKEHGFVDQQTELQLAAVYSADRAILKNLMGTVTQEPPVSNGEAIAPTSESPNIPVSPTVDTRKSGE